MTLKDDGCQLNAAKAKIFISAFGEMYRNNEPIPELSSLNVAELAQQKGFDWKEVCVFRKNKTEAKSRLALQWFKAIEEEWERRRNKHLNSEEKAFAEKVDSFQSVVHDFGQFRVYGEINDRGELIVAVTEFRATTENKEVWDWVESVMKKSKAHYWVMDESKNIDHTCKVDAQHNKIEGSDVYGPDFGKMERQVELSWRIEDKTPDEFKSFLEEVSKSILNKWEEVGVGVM